MWNTCAVLGNGDHILLQRILPDVRCKDGGGEVTNSVLINTDVLKPCPFCGKNVVLISNSETRKFVFSHADLRNCPFYKFEMSWECAKSLTEAKELWNRRWTYDK